MRNDAIDRAIADVARRMTAGDPSDNLRARVLARIGERSVARGRGEADVEARWIRPIVWREAFAAATIALVAFLAYRASRPALLKPNINAVMRAPELSVVREPSPDRDGVTANPSGPAQRAHAIGRSRASEARVAIPPSSIDSLAPPELQFTSLNVADDIDARPLDVPPLEPIAPISVAPLDQGDRR